jgi:Fe-S-cluster containining protein
LLHRDPATGQQQLGLRAPVFKQPWQNEVALGAASTTLGVMRDEPTLERVVELARSAMAATSRLAEGLLARAPEGSVACRAGCDHCCYQSVGVTPPEALAILDHLKRTRSGEALEKLRAHVEERRERTRGLSAAERFSPDHPCIFLEAGRCSIYEARPLSCRGMNSLDAEECRKRLHEPEARRAFLESGAGSRSFMEPIRAFHAVSAGLQLALAELYELDMRPLDLVAAMHLLLSRPSSIGEAWIAREQAFEEARGGDSSGSLGMDELSGALGRD